MAKQRNSDRREVWHVSEDEAPPGGYDVVVSETGQEWHGEAHFAALVDKVVEHMRANSLETNTVLAGRMIQDATCQRLKKERKLTKHAKRLKPVPLALGMFDWMRGTAAYTKIKDFMRRGESVHVDRAEAERRARICSGCSENEQAGIASGKAQKAADAEMLKMIGPRCTNYDRVLGKCKACKCNLKTVVHFRTEVVKAGRGSSKQNLPAHCWKNDL